jgi:serine phosphatase RsbU (regulator of sigma subunit)/catechol 2,3-dioxygenase-like lactoylglutathione lyase family enzyme
MGSFPSSVEVHRSSPGPYLGIHAVKIFVRDQDRSLRFFVDQLGFDVAFDARLQSGDRWVAVSPPDGTAVLTLVAPKPKSKEHNLIGRTSGVVLVTEDVIAKFNEWRQRGVRFNYAPRLRRVRYQRQVPAEGSSSGDQAIVWGGVFTRFKDVDGNTFELVSFDEVSREVEAQRRANADRLESERRSAQELEYAKQVQGRLFPQALPTIKTLEYSGMCIQARQVGGDYYDFLDLGKERFGLVIGDIAGKGMAAALLMANLQASLRSQCAIALDEPQRLLRLVNRLFFENSTEGAYATLFFAEYDDGERRLRYANCGHLCALILRGNGTVERLHSTGTVLGLFEQWDCAMGECRLVAGDTFALYTDGITECFNDAEEDFGEHRLIESLHRNRELPAEMLTRSIVDEVQQFGCGEQHDDITLIVAKCRENGIS